MPSLPDGLKALVKFNQFIVFKVVKGKRCPVDHRTGKRPIDPFKSTNWIDADTAMASAYRLGRKHWAGFVLTDKDPFFCITIRESHGDIRIVGSYRGKAPPHACKHIEHDNMELYTEKYIYTLTGNPNHHGNIEEDGTESLHDMIKTYFPPSFDTVNTQYFQFITVRGAARRYLEKNMHHFVPMIYILSPDTDTLSITGGGEYFRTFVQVGIACICSEVSSDIFKTLGISPKGNKPFPKECDLTPIVEFLRLGGAEYGYPDYNT